MKRSLTATTVDKAKPKAAAYKLTDGGGLYLFVSPTGAKSWRYKYRLLGKEKTYTIGPYPEVSLADARKEHDAARALVADGADPVTERKAEKQELLAASKNTFEAVARDWLAANKPHWSAYYYKQAETTLERDVFPKVGKIKVRDVTAAHLRPILKAVAERTKLPGVKRVRERGAATVAILIRQWCGAIFAYAVAEGLADSDPTYALRKLVKRPKVQHHKHLSRDELPGFMKDLRGFTGTESVKIAVELLALLWVRTAELRKAEKAEFDLEGKTELGPVWRIPAEHVKMKREHLVPLPSRAVELIARQFVLAGNSPFLFPNQRTPKTVMTATTVNRALERLGYAGKLSGHGFRGTASTILHENNFEHAWIEKQLAHDQVNKVAASYNHAEYWPQRREMMEFWQNLLLSDASKVVSIHKGKKTA